MTNTRIIHGDCLEVLRTLESNSFDALVTDPPAGIAFMQSTWDSDKGGRNQWIAWMTQVMTETIRVMKPGAHGLVWALPRTSHWTATALEDAGFEIRDIVTHLFSTGFPHALNVSLAIDKESDVTREVIGRAHGVGSANTESLGEYATEYDATLPTTDAAKEWTGWYTSLKPATENWILVRRPLEKSTVAANTLKYGTGALNIDATRIGTETRIYNLKGGDNLNLLSRPNGSDSSDARGLGAYGVGAKQINIGTTTATGRWPANCVLSHSENCVKTGQTQVKARVINRFDDGAKPFGDGAGHPYTSETFGDENGNETIDTWDCAEDCAVRMLDEQSGVRPGCQTPSLAVGPESILRPGQGGYQQQGPIYPDSGGASRFFATFEGANKFYYTGKASPSERQERTRQAGIMLKLRDDITPEQKLYVIDELRRAGVL